MNLCNISKMPPLLAKKQNSGCVPPHLPDHAPYTSFMFPQMKQELKGRQFADTEDVHRESLAALDSISVDFRRCFQ
jgi:hypothetical protein